MEKVNSKGVKEYNGKKADIPMIRSLAMLKMEKNFIAHCDKGYPRQPYKDFNQPTSFLISRMDDELKELKEAFERKDIVNMQEELADLSNVIDYAFEQLCRFRSYSNNLELFR
ncbi:MAG: hypothetical protein ABSB71_07925 [Candidatus Bathyarchaeia archaeon]